MRRSWIVGVAVGLAAVASASLAPAQAQAQRADRPVVNSAVQVTADPAPIRAHTSPQLARNPKTGELVIVEGDIRGSRKCAVHISVDDGRSWAPGGDPLEPPFTDCSFHADWGPYATMAFDREGNLLMAIEASDPKFFDRTRNDAPRHIFLARSEDSGRTWETKTVYEAPEGDPNKGVNKGATVAVDPKDPRYVYVGWRQGIQAGTAGATEKLKTNIAASSDGGRTWGKPVEITDERGGDFPWMTVTPDGVLHAATWTRVYPAPPMGQPNPVRPLYHWASRDHGKTFDPKNEIDPGNQQHEHPPQIVSDPKRGTLYVTWVAQPDAMNQAPNYKADLEVFFRSSTDGGKTWSARKTLNDDGPGKANQIDPGMSVAPNGRIDVAWYDGRHSPAPLGDRTERGLNDVYYTYSSDGGRTWAPNIRVSDRSADRSIGVWANNVDQRLNLGVASSNAGAYFAWQDTRNANPDFQPEDVYMASVVLDGDAAAAADDSGGAPTWLLAATGLALGMGLAMAVVWLRARRPAGTAPAPA
jgi:hypothetical protein